MSCCQAMPSLATMVESLTFHRGDLDVRASQMSLTCCLCERRIPKSSDVYGLDTEWRRRYPDMVGHLACERCAVNRHVWACRNGDSPHPPGHVPPARVVPDCDSWDHLLGYGTHAYMCFEYPDAAVQQGAAEWLQDVVSRPGVSKLNKERITFALDSTAVPAPTRKASTG